MKKMFLGVLLLVLVVGIASAQTYSSGSGLTGIDVLGAHQNGGRGCAGCHAPHSGAAGGGGNVANNAVAFNDSLSGSIALFGQDVTPLFGVTISFGNGNQANNGGAFLEILPAQGTAYTTQRSELMSIMTCLSCHDGVVAKGQMMNGQSWQQRMNVLPSTVYGTRSIPTLLGNDSNNGNDSSYKNDHPVGVQATLSAVGVWSNNSTSSPIAITVDAVNGVTSISPNSPAYFQFVTNYGFPALAGTESFYGVTIPGGDTNPADVYITCTTCHNQHAMYVYAAPAGKQSGAAIMAGGYYPTYFFVNSPYNPGAGNSSSTLAVSTTQFCRQCHFETANEYYGVNTVKTQF